MPEIISTNEFLEETRDDFHSPTTSTFVPRIPHCRNAVSLIEETLDIDRDTLNKLKKSTKQIHSSGHIQLESELNLSRGLEKLGNGILQTEPELGAGFLKFAVVTKEMANLQKSLMQNLQNMLLFPMDSLLKGEIRGVKGELRRPFDKSLKDYETKYTKLEKEKKAQSRDAGMFRKEVTPAEIADETERERRFLQLHTCEYLLKVNEIKTKKGVDLLKHLVEYYHSLDTYFNEGLKTMEHFGNYVQILSNNLTRIKIGQDDEKKKLIEMRNLLKSTPVLEKEVIEQQRNIGSLINLSSNQQIQTQPAPPSQYKIHQLQGNKSAGLSKIGYLNKKSDGKMRRVWQRRRCNVRDGVLEIHHADESKPPTRVNLLTCQLKIVSEDKKFFDLVSYNRTYHLQSEEEDIDDWISVILNSKESAMSKAFDQKIDNSGLLELTQAILSHVHRLPGNERCADCDSERDTTWLSINLGVILCIECSGVHRTMGVNYSRIQSITLDRIPPSLLILAVTIGNYTMNEILEEGMSNSKPGPDAGMEAKKQYIHEKYIQKSYVIKNLKQNHIIQSIENDDFILLLKCWAEGLDLLEINTNQSTIITTTTPSPIATITTALHLSIEKINNDLRIIDFLIHNSNNAIDKKINGLTPLHLAVEYNNIEIVKLLLRAGADLNLIDNEKNTPNDLANIKKNLLMQELFHHSMEGKKTLFESVDFDWNLGAEDSTDFSDDEIETPEKKRCSYVDSPFRADYRTTNQTPKNIRPKRIAPPAPLLTLHTTTTTTTTTRSTSSDGLITRLGKLVIPPGEPPILKHIIRNNNGCSNNSSGGCSSDDNNKKCRALYDCQADNTDEISFLAGDTIIILNELTEDDNWMEGYVIGSNLKGMFPISFVEFK